MDNGQWQNRYNHEIRKIYKQMELTKNIRLRRLQWVGCVMGIKKGKGAKESSERIHRREKTSWKAQRKMVICSIRDVEMQELEKVGRDRGLEVED